MNSVIEEQALIHSSYTYTTKQSTHYKSSCLSSIKYYVSNSSQQMQCTCQLASQLCLSTCTYFQISFLSFHRFKQIATYRQNNITPSYLVHLQKSEEQQKQENKGKELCLRWCIHHSHPKKLRIEAQWVDEKNGKRAIYGAVSHLFFYLI